MVIAHVREGVFWRQVPQPRPTFAPTTWAFLYRLRHRSLPAIKRPARAQKANCVPALVAAATPRARPRRQEPHAGHWSEEDLNALGA